ncbi:hypothetical protein ACFLVW_05070 [Chloroflexota bacterium]
MNDRQFRTVEQVRQFLEGLEVVGFRYHRLKKAEKGVIRRYVKKVTGYSRSQVSGLIAEYKRTGRLKNTGDIVFPGSIPRQM